MFYEQSFLQEIDIHSDDFLNPCLDLIYILAQDYVKAVK